MSKISVIIPVYGVEKFIERCARSLFEQTLDDIEFIFIDDCTLDRSMTILSKIIEEYRHRFAEMNFVVRTERMPTNSGQAAVRRHGIQLATGDYIIHCDSDDWVEPDMYAKLYERTLQELSDVVICDYYIANSKTERKVVSGCLSQDKTEIIKDLLYQRTSWAVWNKLVKSTLYKDLKEYPLYAMGEDMVMISQVYCDSLNFSYVDEPLYNYFENSSSIMNVHTMEKCIEKFTQVKANTSLILPIIKEKFDKRTFDNISNCLSYNTTIALYPVIYDSEIRKLWWIEMKGRSGLLFDKDAKAIFKLMYLLIVTGIYPLYKKIKK